MNKLDAILAEYAAVEDDTKDKVFGASFVVVNKDGCVYKGSAGRIGIQVDSSSFDSRSSGWIASMTKIVTAIAVLQLVERGLMKLDDDMRPLMSELSDAQVLRGFDDEGHPILVDNDDPITVRQLLSHTSGMTYDLIDPEIQRWSSAIGRKHNALTQTREGWNTPLKFRPGTSWAYGSGIDWAGLVLEKATGQSLGAYMSENIFEPLGMADTTFNRKEMADKFSGRIVEMAYRNPNGSLRTGALPVPEDPPVQSGGAGLFTTAADYSKLLQAVLVAGGGHETILQQRTVDDMFRPQLDGDVRSTLQAFLAGSAIFSGTIDYNHGLSGVINMVGIDGKRRKGALAWGGMSGSHWWIDREAGIAAVLFVNIMDNTDEVVSKLLGKLEEALYSALG